MLAIIIYFFFLQSGPFTGTVVRVIDGDTIEVLKDSVLIRVRLNGIDAPEKSQPYGKKAKEFVANSLAGKTVKVVPFNHDRYGRLIGDIYLSDESWFNEQIVKAGFAWHYKKYSSDEKLARAELIARDLKVGLWQEPSPIAPWDYRYTNKK